MRRTENKNHNKTPNHITLLCWHLHWSVEEKLHESKTSF